MTTFINIVLFPIPEQECFLAKRLFSLTQQLVNILFVALDVAEPGFKPMASGWEARLLPLCYAAHW